MAESAERREQRSTNLGAGAGAARQLTQRRLVVWQVPRNIQPLTSTRLTRNLTKPKPTFLKKNGFQIPREPVWFHQQRGRAGSAPAPRAKADLAAWLLREGWEHSLGLSARFSRPELKSGARSSSSGPPPFSHNTSREGKNLAQSFIKSKSKG